MTFEEFLTFIRRPDHIGNRCSDEYWRHRWEEKKSLSLQELEDDKLALAIMAVRAVAIDYAYEGQKAR